MTGAAILIIVRKMGYTWWSTVTIILLIDNGSLYAEAPIPVNYTAALIETVEKFQLRG